MKTYWIGYRDSIGHAYYYHNNLEAMAEFIRLYFAGKHSLMLWETNEGIIWDIQPNGLNNPNPTPDLPF